MRQTQEENLGRFIDQGWSIEWFASLSALSHESLEGVIFSNELVDAFPVHRVKVSNDTLQEVFIDHENGELCERLNDLSTSDISTYLGGIQNGWPEGYTTEVHLESEQWMEDVAQVLQRGFVVTIDYGHTGQDYYDVSRKDGTFLCYYKHRVSSNPYVRIGEQDMTAHVNFSALAKRGSESGLHVTGFTNLMNFLLGLGVDRMLESLDPESEEMQAAIQFFAPTKLGANIQGFDST